MPRAWGTAALLVAAVLLFVAAVASPEEGEGARGPWLQGDARCRCAAYEELLAAHGGRVPAELQASGVDWTTYGMGCLPHDLNSTVCKPKSDPKCQNITPTPARCFNDGVPPAWCSSHWCYVAEDDCDLSRTPSDLWPRDYYRYWPQGHSCNELAVLHCHLEAAPSHSIGLLAPCLHSHPRAFSCHPSLGCQRSSTAFLHPFNASLLFLLPRGSPR